MVLAVKDIETMGSRLRALRRQRGWSIEDVGRLLHISFSSIAKYERDEQWPPPDRLRAMADLYGVTIDYILNGSRESAHAANLRYAPVVGAVHAGEPIPAAEEIIGEEPIPPNMPNGDYFWLVVRGDCMDAGDRPIKDGFLVLVRKQPEVPSGEVAVVFIPGEGEAVLRRIRRIGNQFFLTADNPKYEPIPINRDVVIVGRVVRIMFDPNGVKEV